MSKKILVATALMGLASVAAADNVGGCGFGSKLFDGQKGIAPQILAVTTNGSTGNQTFGITFGTVGCTQDGVVRSNWKVSAYIEGNSSKLARDMSAGQGESLEALASLMHIDAADKSAFFRTTKDNFARIYNADMLSAQDIMSNLRDVLAADATLARYSASI
ncbi:MAG: DUF3015 family protein [Chitinivorax sp.]